MRTCPSFTYPAELPIVHHKTELLAAIAAHPVVIVAGETGSGKTTQLPKFCLELGYGKKKLIGHTQPRRLAARSVAQQIASELKVSLGSLVGYQVRFHEQLGPHTAIKLMTDGILLAELQRDRDLSHYSTLIIDEAHERTLNIDFILGYLKQLLPRRPDLKIIITSATLDPEQFSRYFNQAPLITFAGRTYPVELRYRPREGITTENGDLLVAITSAIEELRNEAMGDILVFMNGEQEIRAAAKQLTLQPWPEVEVIPLYARLSVQEQQRIFQPHRTRRIILATNIAETSLTVPGIRFVIDPGTARISRYSLRHHVQQLPIAPISQASAEQRAGRCGRIAPGICIRLYSETEFLHRPRFTTPAILRTNLAAVILQMLAIGLQPVEKFPFIDPPNPRQLRAGLKLLQELGAVAEDHNTKTYTLTLLGRALVKLPLDPKLGRMVLAAQQYGCVHELLIITAALSIQDPRERPAEQQQAADSAHRRFAHPHSDFLSWVNLWNYLQTQKKNSSVTALRKKCQQEFLHYLRICEWQEVYSQLHQAARTLTLPINQQPADYRAIHCALLTGLLSQIGRKRPNKGHFQGARGCDFSLFPNSVLFKKAPQWVVVATLLTTNRLWGHTAAKIDPEWIEHLAPAHLLKHHYDEPQWEKQSGRVVATERITLYGLPIIPGRIVPYGHIDPLLARELFIRHALIAGEWEGNYPFWHHNIACLAEARQQEEKARRCDIAIDDAALFHFYDQRLGAEVISVHHFSQWWKEKEPTDPHRLQLTLKLLYKKQSDRNTAETYPDFWQYGEIKLPLCYKFSPGVQADGVTVTVPLVLLHHITPEPFQWQVPGMRSELLTALLERLPKPLRRHFMPLSHFVSALLHRFHSLQQSQPLLSTLSDALYSMSGVSISPQDWDWENLPLHLKITFSIVDSDEQPIAEGKAFDQLQKQLHWQALHALTMLVQYPIPVNQPFIEWPRERVPKSAELLYKAQKITLYPALVDKGTHVTVHFFPTATAQHLAMQSGVQRLLHLTLGSAIKKIVRTITPALQLQLSRLPDASPAAVVADCVAALLKQQLSDQVVWSGTEFQQLKKRMHPWISHHLPLLIEQIIPLADLWFSLKQRVQSLSSVQGEHAYSDITDQLHTLIIPGFVSAYGVQRLPDINRYLLAIQKRLEKLPAQAVKDTQYCLKIATIQQRYQQICHAAATPPSAALLQIRWMIEELRVSYFAQQLGTAFPISEQRISQALQQLATSST